MRIVLTVLLLAACGGALADSGIKLDVAAREHEALAAVIASMPEAKGPDGKPLPPTSVENVAQRVHALAMEQAHCQKFARVVGLSMQQIQEAAQ